MPATCRFAWMKASDEPSLATKPFKETMDEAEAPFNESAYQRLSRFIQQEMRMSHIYQPVMLRELLTRGGTASVREIAKALLAEDRSQVEYYEQITTQMVGRVLTAS